MSSRRWRVAATVWLWWLQGSVASLCEVDTFSVEYGKIQIDLKAHNIPETCCADMRRIMSSTRLMKLKGILPAPRWLHGDEGKSCSEVCVEFGEICIEHARMSSEDTKHAAAQAEVSCNQNLSGVLWLPELQPSFSKDATEASMKGCDKAFAGLNEAIAKRHEQVHMSNREYDKAQPCRKGYYCPAGVIPVVCPTNFTSFPGSSKATDCYPRDHASLERERKLREAMDESYHVAFREHQKALLELWGVNSSVVEQYSIEKEEPVTREELLFWEMEEVRKKTAEKLLEGGGNFRLSRFINSRFSPSKLCRDICRWKRRQGQ
ncbi:hypothetical protein GUITHDRAFT_131468 [Guillardia theta CCMP2712]|uniref:Uncharacterized protein n=1 Tax=Guillardia theta (strain CCMP2712) TaxID=905079 RepID=L1K3N7_GUITC|nr:hypothetical protein GUITHDRAFT_131468 [Guillardia theta CCMP2712]EKX55214.1 hypothetical protein GUITHDRAFT_131468 [Guillardia theta CCMP2712]|eukprot:XP_005842194.1 hypothetical protein GUITHDRAFT_131468 [Guillardia theta CCMP2712]